MQAHAELGSLNLLALVTYMYPGQAALNTKMYPGQAALETKM